MRRITPTTARPCSSNWSCSVLRQDPKVLFFDIETAPNLAYVWGQWQQDVIEHVTPWYVLCVGWQWQGGKVESVALPDFPDTYRADPEDDSAVLRVLAGLLDEANVVIAHNGDKFDIRKVNARLAINGFDAPSPYATVDTLKLARRHFAFNSNRLNDVAQVLGIGKKEPHNGFRLWRDCMAGDPKAWAKMVRYARQDVRLLVDVYERLRPWLRNHPSVNMMADRPDACPICSVSGSNLIRRGIRYTKVGAHQQWWCRECRCYSRERLSRLTVMDERRPQRVS